MKTALALMAAKLLTTDGVVPQDRIDGASLRCATLNQRETRAKRLHFFACVNLDTNEVRGAFLKKNGNIACEVTGTFDGQCLNLEACGETASDCL